MDVRGTALSSLGLALLIAGLGCGGVGGGAVDAPAEPAQVGVQDRDGAAPGAAASPKTLEFGKPSTWSQDKESYTADGHAVIHYVLSGPSATVQLILHPPGAVPPDPEVERAVFQEGLRSQVPDGLAFDEVVPETFTVGEQSFAGTVQGLTLRTADGVVHGEHRSFVVQGPRTSCLVVVDVPDVSDATAESDVSEVLQRLRVP